MSEAGLQLDSSTKKTSAATKAAAFVPVVTEVLGLATDKMARDSEYEFLKSSIDNSKETFLFNANVKKQQLEDIRIATADVLTERGIKALEEEATLRAGAAETGTSGGTTQVNIDSSYVREMQDKTQILRDSKRQRTSVISGMESDLFGFKNNLTSIRNSQTSTAQAALSTANTAIAGFSTGLSFLNTTSKEHLFGAQKNINPDNTEG